MQGFMPGREAKMEETARNDKKNKYDHRSKNFGTKIFQIVRVFAVDLNALQPAGLAGVNRNAANRHAAACRESIARSREAESPVRDDVEVAEGSFGVWGAKGRGVAHEGKPSF